jgi:hypothetical protein
MAGAGRIAPSPLLAQYPAVLNAPHAARCVGVPADNLARGDRSEMERAVMGSVRVTSSVALSTLKSQGHETVKFGEVHWFGKKGERAVSESLFPRLHEQTP